MSSSSEELTVYRSRVWIRNTRETPDLSEKGNLTCCEWLDNEADDHYDVLVLDKAVRPRPVTGRVSGLLISLVTSHSLISTT